ncbi:MAG: hypothetical protein PG981_000722 [Wolbachia endosymbiont of Ctenocephalides orientis wCori]|nr:MAG: hypothetical protein PG981_000722 [Wolbachia endosymbiont of Ctenocephalides orientis wCori]
MIRDWLSENIFQPVKNSCNYIKEKIFGEVDTNVTEENAGFVVEQQDITPAANEHDIL